MHFTRIRSVQAVSQGSQNSLAPLGTGLNAQTVRELLTHVFACSPTRARLDSLTRWRHNKKPLETREERLDASRYCRLIARWSSR